MRFKKISLIFVIVLSVFSLGMNPRAQSKVDQQLNDVISRSMSDQVIQDIESAYAAEDADLLMTFIDKSFNGRANFQVVMQEYFAYVDHPHLHFVIYMVTSYKDKLSIRAHWLKKARTASGVMINIQGTCTIDLKKKPNGLKIVKIEKDNPFF